MRPWHQARADTSQAAGSGLDIAGASAATGAALDLQPYGGGGGGSWAQSPTGIGSDLGSATGGGGSLGSDSLGSFIMPPERAIRRPLTTDDAKSLHWCRLPPPKPVPRPPEGTELVCKFEPDNVRRCRAKAPALSSSFSSSACPPRVRLRKTHHILDLLADALALQPLACFDRIGSGSACRWSGWI